MYALRHYLVMEPDRASFRNSQLDYPNKRLVQIQAFGDFRVIFLHKVIASVISCRPCIRQMWRSHHEWIVDSR